MVNVEKRNVFSMFVHVITYPKITIVYNKSYRVDESISVYMNRADLFG